MIRLCKKIEVGYLSFLIRDSPTPTIHPPDGIFVTMYDKKMHHRECTGKWFDKQTPWTIQDENTLIDETAVNAKTTSRLTGGQYLNVTVDKYTITYLYKKRTKKMIRGWHGIKKDAFYLPSVFLENTFEDGSWITSDDALWKPNKHFKLSHTFKKLQEKAGNINKTRKYFKQYQLYDSHVSHKTL